MGKIINEQSHFVPWARVPSVPASATVREALEQLQSRHVGGLIVNGWKGDSFVKGESLAQAILVAARQSTETFPPMPAGFGSAPAADRWDSVLNGEIGQFLGQIRAIKDRRGEPGAVLIVRKRLYDEIGDEGDQVAVVEDQADAKLGIFFNQEHFADVFNANPPIWLCEKDPDPHENTDPDHGNCSYCWRKLVKVK
jgi:hypothetical protein